MSKNSENFQKIKPLKAGQKIVCLGHTVTNLNFLVLQSTCTLFEAVIGLGAGSYRHLWHVPHY